MKLDQTSYKAAWNINDLNLLCKMGIYTEYSSGADTFHWSLKRLIWVGNNLWFLSLQPLNWAFREWFFFNLKQPNQCKIFLALWIWLQWLYEKLLVKMSFGRPSWINASLACSSLTWLSFGVTSTGDTCVKYVVLLNYRNNHWKQLEDLSL